ncbi:MAG TPA: molybdopterin cofactor-binding domain-containing protein, partial [Vicinamibacterales bacterium]|nr:molybdopterin cofactor-binding domain-containing protein [Vicinamibacterales bacterium]
MSELDPHDVSDGLKYRFDVDRRGFLRLLGAGVAVAVAHPSMDHNVAARQPGAAVPSDVSAWIHVGENGRVTAFTGKTEVGQNIRTSLAQAVSEELRVSMSLITILMADTARVPFDSGTLGSRTTPVMSVQLRKAAAAARQALIGIAARRWELPATELDASEGRVSHKSSGRSANYAELAGANASLNVIDDKEPLTPSSNWQTLGTAVRKINGVDFVTGRHQFTSDMSRPGMLHGRVKRPPAAGAVLVSADITDAAARPGVRV